MVEGGTIEDYQVEHVFECIGRKGMRLNARKTVRAGNGSNLILLAIDDATEASDRLRELARLRALAKGIVDTLRDPLLVLDSRLEVIEASRAFYATFRVDADQTIGRNLAELGEGQWANRALIHLLTEVIPDHTTLEAHEITHDFPGIGTWTFLLNARKIFREGNNTRTLLLAMEDVTEWRRVAREREAALAQPGRLLEELNHRVMNSRSMIGSIIAMEGRTLSD